MIPEKKPCPCGYVSPTTGKGCPQVILSGFGNPMDVETADEIIETYKDAARLNFLLANPGVCATLQFQLARKRREWIDYQMTKPGRKKRAKETE